MTKKVIPFRHLHLGSILIVTSFAIIRNWWAHMSKQII